MKCEPKVPKWMVRHCDEVTDIDDMDIPVAFYKIGEDYVDVGGHYTAQQLRELADLIDSCLEVGGD